VFLSSERAQGKGMSFRSHAAVVDERSDDNVQSERCPLRPDDMVLRRSAFDFLKSKGIMPNNALFTKKEAKSVLHSTSLEEYGRPGDTGTELCFLLTEQEEDNPMDGPKVVFDGSYTVLAYKLGL
jgi:hypothetical protein